MPYALRLLLHQGINLLFCTHPEREKIQSIQGKMDRKLTVFVAPFWVWAVKIELQTHTRENNKKQLAPRTVLTIQQDCLKSNYVLVSVLCGFYLLFTCFSSINRGAQNV